MLATRTKELIEQAHVPHEVIWHEPAYTASRTAAVSHVPGRQFAKVVVAQARAGHPVMAVLPATCHVDLEALAEAAGEGPLALVAEDELGRLFADCEVGAMPPFGSPYGMPVYVSRCLTRSYEIYFPAGSHRETVRMRYDEFAHLAHPHVTDICRHH